MDKQVKRIKRELVKNGAILDIYTDTMQLPDGKLEEWDFISQKRCSSSCTGERRWKDSDGTSIPECDRPNDT